jgi:hypothetical protein
MIIKRIAFCFTVFIWIAAFGFSGCDRPWTGQLRGTVTDAETEEGISGVLVKATALKNGYGVTAVTDDAGEYRIRDARWGANRVTVYHPRFYPSEKYTDVIRDSVVEIDFAVARRTLYMDTDLHVQIVNVNGDPIENAVVDLYQLRRSVYEYYFYISTKVTLEDGHLTFALPRIFEDEVIQLQLRVAALGYHDQIRDFAVSWGAYDPRITIVMDRV